CHRAVASESWKGTCGGALRSGWKEAGVCRWRPVHDEPGADAGGWQARGIPGARNFQFDRRCADLPAQPERRAWPCESAEYSCCRIESETATDGFTGCGDDEEKHSCGAQLRSPAVAAERGDGGCGYEVAGPDDGEGAHAEA